MSAVWPLVQAKRCDGQHHARAVAWASSITPVRAPLAQPPQPTLDVPSGSVRHEVSCAVCADAEVGDRRERPVVEPQRAVAELPVGQEAEDLTAQATRLDRREGTRGPDPWRSVGGARSTGVQRQAALERQGDGWARREDEAIRRVRLGLEVLDRGLAGRGGKRLGSGSRRERAGDGQAGQGDGQCQRREESDERAAEGRTGLGHGTSGSCGGTAPYGAWAAWATPRRSWYGRVRCGPVAFLSRAGGPALASGEACRRLEFALRGQAHGVDAAQHDDPAG